MSQNALLLPSTGRLMLGPDGIVRDIPRAPLKSELDTPGPDFDPRDPRVDTTEPDGEPGVCFAYHRDDEGEPGVCFAYHRDDEGEPGVCFAFYGSTEIAYCSAAADR
jgi:hypothetical protein